MIRLGYTTDYCRVPECWQCPKSSADLFGGSNGLNLEIMSADGTNGSRLPDSFTQLKDSQYLGVVTAEQGRVIDANDAYLQIIGRSREELERGGIDWREITPPEHGDRDNRAIEELQRYGACVPFEKLYIRPNGSRIPILIGAVRLQSDPLRWVCYVIDLSQQKAAAEAEERERAVQEKGRLVNLLAHEINNPLSILTNALFLLANNQHLDADAKRLVDESSRALKRIEESVQAILTAAADLPMRP
jgi:PAS domain S-box-containing protein